METKKNGATAPTVYPTKQPGQPAKLEHLNVSNRFAQVRRWLKLFIISIALWGIIPRSWADHLVGGLRHD